MDITQYEIEIRRHALVRAMQGGITPDMVEATLKGGKIKRFGKNNVKFYKRYKNFTLICVDEIVGTKIKIVTITVGGDKMKRCSECKEEMKELKAKTPEGVEYRYHKCYKCGEEIVSMQQLHDVAEEYRAMKRYHAKLSKWGMSLGVRIPKELVKKYNLKDNETVSMIADKECIKIIPA